MRNSVLVGTRLLRLAPHTTAHRAVVKSTGMRCLPVVSFARQVTARLAGTFPKRRVSGDAAPGVAVVHVLRVDTRTRWLAVVVEIRVVRDTLLAFR